MNLTNTRDAAADSSRQTAEDKLDKGSVQNVGTAMDESIQSKRPARRHTLRWWSEQFDLPLSTLYKAVEQGYLKAMKPKGSSYVVRPLDFQAWFGGESMDIPTDPPPDGATTAAPATPASKSSPSFAHVQYQRLPG